VTRFSVAVMALVLVASVIMTGCGGGAQQNNPSQGSKAQKSDQESTTKQEAANRESLSGTVVKILSDKDKIYVKPPKVKAVKIKYKPDNVDVTLAGKQVEPDAISVGQQATVKYVKKTNNSREVNLARSIWLQPGSGATEGNETTG
jgi:hypothetical protein